MRFLSFSEIMISTEFNILTKTASREGSDVNRSENELDMRNQRTLTYRGPPWQIPVRFFFESKNKKR